MKKAHVILWGFLWIKKPSPHFVTTREQGKSALCAHTRFSSILRIGAPPSRLLFKITPCASAPNYFGDPVLLVLEISRNEINMDQCYYPLTRKFWNPGSIHTIVHLFSFSSNHANFQGHLRNHAHSWAMSHYIWGPHRGWREGVICRFLGVKTWRRDCEKNWARRRDWGK